MSPASFTLGWAIVDHGQINVKTVSDTRRAALVNWLCVVGRVLVLANWTDEQIEEAWEANRAPAVFAVRVRITAEEPIL